RIAGWAFGIKNGDSRIELHGLLEYAVIGVLFSGKPVREIPVEFQKSVQGFLLEIGPDAVLLPFGRDIDSGFIPEVTGNPDNRVFTSSCNRQIVVLAKVIFTDELVVPDGAGAEVPVNSVLKKLFRRKYVWLCGHDVVFNVTVVGDRYVSGFPRL